MGANNYMYKYIYVLGICEINRPQNNAHTRTNVHIYLIVDRKTIRTGREDKVEK